MGWLVSEDNMTKKEYVQKVINESMSPFNVLDHSVRGNVIYMVVQKALTSFTATEKTFPSVGKYKTYPSGWLPEIRGENEVFIAVILISKFKRTGWGYKAMTESSFPYYYDCPEKFLKMSTVTNESSTSWRQSCRDYRKKKAELVKSLKDIKPNTLLLLGDNKRSVVIFKNIYNKGATQFVAKDVDGNIYRYPSSWIEKIFDYAPSSSITDVA